MGKKPFEGPAAARLLLKWMSAYDDNHSVIENFEETYSEVRRSRGIFRADCWYWRHTLGTVPAYLKMVAAWRVVLFTNYLKTFVRIIKRNRMFSLINISGLAVGLSVCMIITLWVQRELSCDRFHENAHRIYRVERELFRDNLYSRWPITSGAYKQALINDYPEITNAMRLWRRVFAITDFRNFVHRQELYAVDDSIFGIFDFSLTEGDERTALEDPMTVVLTRRLAALYFGIEDVLGKSLSLELNGQPTDFKVTGILEEVPENSHIHFDMLISISSYPEDGFTDWRGNYLYTYVLVEEGTDRGELDEKLKSFVSHRLEPHYGDLVSPGVGIHEVLRMSLFPLTDIHLNPSVNWEIESGGSTASIYIFFSIALLILVIACVNFVNLSTARAGKRAREVSLRKTLGAGNRQLRWQFLQESLLFVFLALMIAIGLDVLLIPMFNRVFEVNLAVHSLFQGNNPIFLAGSVVLVGISAGLYPALFLTRFEPAGILKQGILSAKGRSAFRRTSVIIQFAISVTLIIGVLTIYKQMTYIQNRSLGFEKESLVILPVRSRRVADSYEAFRSELKQSSQIISVSASSVIPADSAYSDASIYNRQVSDEPMHIIQYPGDYDLVETYRMEILAGRGFSRWFGADTQGTLILNEAACRRIGWMPEEAVGKRLDFGNRAEAARVVGVVKDFHFKSLRREIEPLALILIPDFIRAVTVRVSPGPVEPRLALIEEKWNSTFPGEEFSSFFLESRIRRLYAGDLKMQRIFIAFAALSILVACLGLFGLAAFTAEVRTKEIGIRKVLGASMGGVTFLLSAEFVKWIALSNIAAWPLAWGLMNRWLQNFAFRVELGWFVFVSASLLALLIAILAFGFQTVRAARSHPVVCLRYE